jgi:hypothetical protein
MTQAWAPPSTYLHDLTNRLTANPRLDIEADFRNLCVQLGMSTNARRTAVIAFRRFCSQLRAVSEPQVLAQLMQRPRRAGSA